MKSFILPWHALSIAALTVLSLSHGSAHAHVTLENQKAEAGSYYKAVLKVGHGCEGSPIRQLLVEIPDGVQGAKPMPKAGWQLEIERTQLKQPYSSHGKRITEDVARIRWVGGSLPDGYYDEFVIAAKLPEQAGAMYWKVSQVCEAGRIDWTQIPVDGKKRSDYPTPAALLEIVPKAHKEHQH